MHPQLDRVVGIEPGVRAVAIRNVPSTLSVLDSHFPRMPVLPGVFLLGDMVAVAVLAVPGDGRRLTAARRVRFRQFVRPGDRIVIEVSVKGHVKTVTQFQASARVEDATVATALLEMAP